uniref:Uncharacterized protein n=1 Tax=Heterosigma akashiwo TaxID=2829 RepID=A0A7S3UYK4_HETAK
MGISFEAFIQMAAEPGAKEKMAANFLGWQGRALPPDWCGELVDLFSPDDKNPDSRRFIDWIDETMCISADTGGEKWGRKWDKETSVNPILNYKTPGVTTTNFASKVPDDAPDAVKAEVAAGALCFTVTMGTVFGQKVLKWNGLYDGKGGHFTPAGGHVPASDTDNFWVYTRVTDGVKVDY